MIRFGLALLAVLLAAGPAAAQYPERPVTAVVGYPAGGLADVTLRAVVEGMKKRFPKGVAVVNRPGAGGSIGASEVIRSKPDGYTFGLMPLSNLVIQPQAMDLPYKTPDDYIPVINLVAWYPLLAVKADAPWKSAQEFLAAARANPGKLRVGSPGEAIVAQPGEVRPLAEGRRMRVLGVFQPSRNPSFPDAPTLKEVGYPVHNGAWFLLLLPNGTPPDVVRHLHDAAKAAIEDPAFTGFAKARVIDVDYRPGDKLRADLWTEFKAHTEILTRIGMLKK
jgi:tripartite-type tricarboxylate transporter receptor subunit TctC